MALYPGAVKRLIPPGSNDPAIIAMGAILHVDAANSGSLYSYFNGPSGGIESHFFVRKDGVVEQYRDTRFEADANYHANSFDKGGRTYGYVSIETQGFASGEWNDAQLREIKKLLLWLSQTHGFPLKKCASPTDPGVGWHVMWGAPGPWTPHAKVCPGPDRVKQFNNVLVPWFAHATAPEEDDMPNTQAEIAAGSYDGTRQWGLDMWAKPTGTGTHFIRDTKAGLAALAQQNAALTTQLGGLTAAVQALAQNQGLDPAAILAAVTTATEAGVDRALADLKITLTTDEETP